MRYIATALMIMAASCGPETSTTPDTALIDRLERKLAEVPCIKPLTKWDRKYAFGLGSAPDAPDRQIVHFVFREAGKFEFREGRTSVSTENIVSVDDRSYLFADGTYTPATGKLEVRSCGQSAR